MGFVGRQDFCDAAERSKLNPLAAYAVYDALSGGKGSFVSPTIYEETLGEWKKEGGALTGFKKKLEAAVLTRVSSYAGLAFLLLLTLDFIVENGIQGWLS